MILSKLSSKDKEPIPASVRVGEGLSRDDQRRLDSIERKHIKDLIKNERWIENSAFKKWDKIATEFKKYFAGNRKTPPINDKGLINYLSSEGVTTNKLVAYIMGINVVSNNYITGGILHLSDVKGNIHDLIDDLKGGVFQDVKDKNLVFHMLGNIQYPIIYGRVYPHELKSYYKIKGYKGVDVRIAANDIFKANVLCHNDVSGSQIMMCSNPRRGGSSTIYLPDMRASINTIVQEKLNNTLGDNMDNMIKEQHDKIEKAQNKINLVLGNNGKAYVLSPDMKKFMAGPDLLDVNAYVEGTKKEPLNVPIDKYYEAKGITVPGKNKTGTGSQTRQTSTNTNQSRNTTGSKFDWSKWGGSEKAFIAAAKKKGITGDKLLEFAKLKKIPLSALASPADEMNAAFDEFLSGGNDKGAVVEQPAGEAELGAAEQEAEVPVASAVVDKPGRMPRELTPEELEKLKWKALKVMSTNKLGNAQLSQLYDKRGLGQMITGVPPEMIKALAKLYSRDLEIGDNLRPLQRKFKTIDAMNQSFADKGFVAPTTTTHSGRVMYTPDPRMWGETHGIPFVTLQMPDGTEVKLIDDTKIDVPSFMYQEGGKPMDIAGVTMGGKPYSFAQQKAEEPKEGSKGAEKKEETKKEEPKKEESKKEDEKEGSSTTNDNKEESTEEKKVDPNQKTLDVFTKKSGLDIFGVYDSIYAVKKADMDKECEIFNDRCDSIAKSVSSMDEATLNKILKSSDLENSDELVISMAKSIYAKEGRELPCRMDDIDVPYEGIMKSAAKLREDNPKAYDVLLDSVHKAVVAERERALKEMYSTKN